MPWWMIAALVCLIIGPFDALYLHIRAEKRREALRRGREADAANEAAHEESPGNDS